MSKTIEVTDEMYDRLIEISNQLNTQDHRCTAMPYFFQVREKKRINGVDGDYDTDGFVWLSPYGDSTVENDSDSMKETLKERGIQFGETISDGALEDLMEQEGYSKGYFRIEEVLSNAFLTEKACKEHIRLNHYHYSEPVDYLSHASRNPELEFVAEFLCGLTNGKIHK